MAAWRFSGDNLRHAATLLWQGRNPAARVYDSLGPDFFLALEPGWLNLGLWEGEGDEGEAPAAVRRLVTTLAHALPTRGDVLDVGNGLGAQDPLIADVVQPRRLVALNVTLSQLIAGRARLRTAGATPVNADAVRLPLADESLDGVISVEAAFHFRSRARFLGEAFRVLRPGGVLSMSDIPTRRLPRGPLELASGLTQLRVWGLDASAAASDGRITALVRAAGFTDVRAELVGERVIGPALRVVRRRLEAGVDAPTTATAASRVMLAQVELLWRRRIIDYLLLRAVRP
jgi:erythromycin 3''-O-methyltransferase